MVGRWSVPKCGDEEEFPLTPGEVDMLRRAFAVRVAYPELMFFRLASWYLLKGRLVGAFSLLDRIGYHIPWLRAYSYASISTSPERVERTLDEPLNWARNRSGAKRRAFSRQGCGEITFESRLSSYATLSTMACLLETFNEGLQSGQLSRAVHLYDRSYGSLSGR